MPKKKRKSYQPIQIPWNELVLDRDNPRLPEKIQGQPSEKILSYLFKHEDLSELVISMLKSGFFAHEPLIVERVAESEPGFDSRKTQYRVLEGNRRLGALLVLHGSEVAEDIVGLDEITSDYSDDAIADLQEIPCVVVEDRDDVRRFLGFRHIGGMKKWSSEAKARYLAREVAKAAEAGASNPFKQVADEVGSNVTGVRNSYLAIRILQEASRQGLSVFELQRDRFGVWTRCLNSAEIRAYIGLGEKLPNRYEDAEAQLVSLSKEGLRLVTADLQTRPGGHKPVLADSRDATPYGQVLADERAHHVLRETGRLDLAQHALRAGTLDSRLRDLSDRCEMLQSEVEEADYSSELEEAAKRLAVKARGIHSAVVALRDLEKELL